MKIRFNELRVITRQTTEVVSLWHDVTFIHGPVGTGKSTVARLIDFCFGGRLDRAPAMQKEFLAAQLLLQVGNYSVQMERAATDGSVVRVTWEGGEGDLGSVNAPLDAGASPIIGDDVFNLSDLVFRLAGIRPMKVRKSKRDPESPLVRLSIRDLFWYCYLRQDRLDSSFFCLDDPFKRLKSMDAIHFVLGLHSERLNELEIELGRTQDSQRAKRAAVDQIRKFLSQFQLGSEIELDVQVKEAEDQLALALRTRQELDESHQTTTHAIEPLRQALRRLSAELGLDEQALADLRDRIDQQQALRSELIAAKVKSTRADVATSVLSGVEFERCPRCGSDLEEHRRPAQDSCYLCGTASGLSPGPSLPDTEVLRRDLNARIDGLADSIARHKRELGRQEQKAQELTRRKSVMDQELAAELGRYDSAYVSNVRAAERKVASLEERIQMLQRLQRMPSAIKDLEREAGELQGRIDNLRSDIKAERERLGNADQHIDRLQMIFFNIMREIGFPGVDATDRVVINQRSWMPEVWHGGDAEIVWSFSDAGSGGKKTLFNVCYALAVHELAIEAGLPLPTFLIIDSPTKNISRDINAQLVDALYKYIYALAERSHAKCRLQLLLIDSDLVSPQSQELEFHHRLMSPDDPENPPLISYYRGP